MRLLPLPLSSSFGFCAFLARLFEEGSYDMVILLPEVLLALERFDIAPFKALFEVLP